MNHSNRAIYQIFTYVKTSKINMDDNGHTLFSQDYFIAILSILYLTVKNNNAVFKIDSTILTFLN